MADGTRWLRAYGTLPHPNILGGYLVMTLTGPLIGYVVGGRRGWLVPLAFISAAAFLTFSRAAWLALAVLLASMVLLVPGGQRGRAVRAALCVAGVALALAAVLGPLVWVRVTAPVSVSLEASSTLERLELARWAFDFIRQRPLTGVGAAAFGPAMVANGAPGAEPVHNVVLLAMAETGLGGGAAAAAFGLALLWTAWRGRGLDAARSILAAGLLGLCVLALFDHYLWSLAPGRLWAALAVGVFAGMSATASRVAAGPLRPP
jgi:O-antigen ligase